MVRRMLRPGCMRALMTGQVYGLALVLAVASACEGTDGRGAVTEALVGTWTRDHTEPAELRDQHAFGADGTYTFDENKPTDRTSEDHLAGTYVASDVEVTATAVDSPSGARSRITFSYYANESLFSSHALHPEGAHSGVVGRWRGLLKIENLDEPATTPDGSAVAYDFHADGTFTSTVTLHDGAPPQTFGGTYVMEEGNILRATRTSPPGSIVTLGTSLRLLDGVALVDANAIWHRR
jgi:hypothetical protein